MRIQVFEHQRLTLSETFQQQHLNALLRFNDLHGNKYFTIIHRGIKFKSYVGVLQIGRLTIEILPKADEYKEGNAPQWRSVLLEMLRYTRHLKIETISKAPLSISKQSLLDIYLHVFLFEVKKIIQKGIVKAYKSVATQRTRLKGQIKFQKHIAKNLVHKERFYTDAQEYIFNHELHQILVKALSVVEQTSVSIEIQGQARRLRQQLPQVDDWKAGSTLKQLKLNRKTAHYEYALNIAQLILLNYCPDLKSGSFDILAVLLDMNQLFEEYVFESLRKAVHEAGFKIKGQPLKPFWQTKTSIRPDILVETPKQNYVLDTKWKILKRNTPENEDLKQMFVYGHYFKATKSVLIYPQVDTTLSYQSGIFHQKMYDEKTETLSEQTCDLAFAPIVKDGKLNLNIGKELLEEMIKDKTVDK
jgi:5-methylcytosine-specific restriction enzyme subunit McrC